MCGGGKAPKADPMVGQAAMLSAQTGQQWLDFRRQAYEEAKPRLEQMDNLSMQVAQQGLQASQFQDQVAREQYAQYQKLGVPAIERMYGDAAKYGSAENQEIAAQEAGTDVQQQLAASRQANTRAMIRMGVNPNSGAFQSMANDQALSGAVAQAGAMTGARKNVRDQGIMLTKDAAGFAAGQPSNAAATFASSVQSGLGGLSALATANQGHNQNTQVMGQGMAGAMSGYGQQANILNADYANRLQAYQINKQSSSANITGLLGAAGTAAGIAF